MRGEIPHYSLIWLLYSYTQAEKQADLQLLPPTWKSFRKIITCLIEHIKKLTLLCELWPEFFYKKKSTIKVMKRNTTMQRPLPQSIIKPYQNNFFPVLGNFKVAITWVQFSVCITAAIPDFPRFYWAKQRSPQNSTVIKSGSVKPGKV